MEAPYLFLKHAQACLRITTTTRGIMRAYFIIGSSLVHLHYLLGTPFMLPSEKGHARNLRHGSMIFVLGWNPTVT